MEPRTQVTVTDHVATVTLTRPDRHNALDEHMLKAIHAAIDEVSGNKDVRVVVLHGEGPSFCSGLDVGSFMTGQSAMSIEDLLQREEGAQANFVQGVVTGWLDMPAPVIAALHGAVYGGGIQIALGADVRVCHPDARLSIMETRWGLVPDMGITRSLPRLVGIDVAKELTYSGRVVGAEEALRLGLVTELAHDPYARAQEIAATWAARSPDAVQRAKRLFDQAWNLESGAALVLEEALQLELLGSPNQLEAVRAGLLKETPRFT
jgi:enoyl-CoA hydratase/carnithine racemase